MPSTTRDSTRSGGSTDVTSTGSPSDRLGQLMTQLGERFSHRNEARKRRAEMQERVTLHNQQMEAMRVERARRGAEERETADMQPVSRAPFGAIQRRMQGVVSANQPAMAGNQAREYDAKRRAVDVSHVPMDRPRHPLAQSDVNRTLILADQLPSKSVPVTHPPQHLQPQRTSVFGKTTNAFARIADKLPPQVAPPGVGVQVNSPHQGRPAIVPAFSRPTAVYPGHKPVVAQPVPPVIATEPESETGNHPTSDTSFESMNDMDSLFNAGGDEVEALFRACDGF